MYTPSIALNTTAENMLNLSKSPNTEGGKKLVPIGPINIAVKAIIAQRLRDFSPTLFDDIANKIKDERDSTTTAIVTARCMKF